METDAKVMQTASPDSAASSTSAKPLQPAADIPAAWLRRLWERMAVLYPVLWPQRNGDMPQDLGTGALTVAGEVWRELLAGMTAEQLQLGLKRCVLRHSEFPPQPQEFRALCLGVPTLAEVRVLLRDDGAVKPPFVVLMFQHLDYYNWRMADERSASRMLAEAYAIAREHVMAGGELPKPVAAIEQKREPPRPGPKIAPEEVFEEARKAFGVPDRKTAAAGGA